MGRRRSSSTGSHVIPRTCSRDGREEPDPGGAPTGVCTTKWDSRATCTHLCRLTCRAAMGATQTGKGLGAWYPCWEVTRGAGPLVLVVESLEAGEVGSGSLPCCETGGLRTSQRPLTLGCAPSMDL